VPAGYLTDLQSDLGDLAKLAKYNNGYKYILVAIDVLSKRIYAAPIKKKEFNDMIPAFDKIFGQMERLPYRIFTDKGGEYVGKEMKTYFKKKDIIKIECNSSMVKASLAENALKRIKQRIYRYFHSEGNYKWIDILDKVVNGINHAKSRVLGGLRPVDISFKNAQEIRLKNYGPILKKQKITKVPRYKTDDYVRMSRNKPIFAKGYTPSFDNEIIQIEKAMPASSPDRVVNYFVKDQKGEPFKGYFYEPDLTKVRKDEKKPYRIEREIKRKKDKNGKWQYLVQFFADPVPQWIDESYLL
jgi:hypothetical protein